MGCAFNLFGGQISLVPCPMLIYRLLHGISPKFMHNNLKQLWSRVRLPTFWVRVTYLLNGQHSLEFILLLSLPENMLLDLLSPCIAFQPLSGAILRFTQVSLHPYLA